MSTTYSGDPAAVSNSLSATIIGATNASPIVIQTPTPHGFATNDIVDVSGVGGNTAANDEWKITVVDATHFSLNGSTGNAPYTSGGTAVDISLTPGSPIPSDGDDETGASVDVAIEKLFDRTQFLNAKHSSKLLLKEIKTQGTISLGSTFWTSGVWGTKATFDNASAQLLDSIAVGANDTLVLDFEVSLDMNSTNTGDQQGTIRLQYSLDGGTTFLVAGTSLASIRDVNWNGDRKVQPVTLRAVIPPLGSAATVGIYVNGCIPVGSVLGTSLRGFDAWTLTTTHYVPY